MIDGAKIAKKINNAAKRVKKIIVPPMKTTGLLPDIKWLLPNE